MSTFRCPVCDYVYDETVGAPREGFPPGTPWATISDDWPCPDCGVREKIDFLGAGSEASGPDDLGAGGEASGPDDLGAGGEASGPDDLGAGGEASGPDEISEGNSVR